jgi:hypothetical protein
MRKTTTSHSAEDAEGQPFAYKVDTVEVLIRLGDALLEADDFSRQCVEEWDQFLRGEGLLA